MRCIICVSILSLALASSGCGGDADRSPSASSAADDAMYSADIDPISDTMDAEASDDYAMTDMDTYDAEMEVDPTAGEVYDDAMVEDLATTEDYDAAMTSELEVSAEIGTDDVYTDDATVGDGDGGGRREAPKDFLGKAQWALLQGRDDDAIQFLYAHVLTNDEAAIVTLREMGWVPALKRPALTVRWGVGVNLVAPPEMQGNLHPIGVPQKLAEAVRRPRRGGGYGGVAEAEAGGMDAAMDGVAMEGQEGGHLGRNNPLAKLTGEFGGQLAEQFLERQQRGDYGVFLREADVKPKGQVDHAAGGYDSGGGQAKGPDDQQQVVPGVTFIGLNDEKKLVERARDLGHDVLVVFHVQAGRAPRTGYITNNTRLSVYDVSTGKELHKSAALNNIAVQRARDAKKDGDDPLEKEISALFKFVDENYKMAPVPEGLKPEHALGRVKALIASSHEHPLPVLTEIKFYHTRGLLTDEHLAAAYGRVVDPHVATALTTGDEEVRKEVLRDWLPRD